MPLNLDVEGPYEVPRTRHATGYQLITESDAKKFWADHEHLRNAVGCYIFGMRAGGGILPGYVGKTTNGFAREVFTPHKLLRFQEYMTKTLRGTPVLFFAVAECRRGRVNEAAIQECEKYLIAVAAATNPDLMNVKGTRAPCFVIPHVSDGKRGRPTLASQTLCRALGLAEPKVRSPKTVPVPEAYDIQAIVGQIATAPIAEESQAA